MQSTKCCSTVDDPKPACVWTTIRIPNYWKYHHWWNMLWWCYYSQTSILLAMMCLHVWNSTYTSLTPDREVLSPPFH